MSRDIVVTIGDGWLDSPSQRQAAVEEILGPRSPVIDHALTALLYRRMFWVDDRTWTVYAVSRDQRVLMYCDEPGEFPGVAYYRWFPAEVLSKAEAKRLDH